ncbi:MAG: CHASE3 domain-containing protein [Gallionellaceae bacterium]
MKKPFTPHAITRYAPTIGLVLALALILAIAVLSDRSMANAIERTSWVAHTEEVIAVAEDIQSAIVDSETAARGFVITSEAYFIEPHTAARDAVQTKIKHLFELTSDNPRQQARLREVQALAEERFGISEQMIRLQKIGRHEDAVGVVRSGSGKALMDRIREQIAAIKTEERALLTVRVSKAENAFTFTRRIIALGDGLAILLLVFAFVLLVRNEARLRQHNAIVEQLNDEITRNATQVEAANKELEAFSYSVSHDLRTPLRAIDGFSQALLEDYADRLDDQAKDYLNRVRGATQRMGHLIDDMLTLSRVTRAEMRRGTVDLSALAADVLAELQKSEPRRKVDWRIESGLVAEGDAQLLRVALVNLLGNAWKFTGKTANAKIEFGAMRNTDGTTGFFVRDNGAGFDMAYADKLFGAFQRLHLASEFPGTGIGLATVQRIIHRHGGRVWAEGAVGKGATFYFSL